jgi:signal transduction histidine kinase
VACLLLAIFLPPGVLKGIFIFAVLGMIAVLLVLAGNLLFNLSTITDMKELDKRLKDDHE